MRLNARMSFGPHRSPLQYALANVAATMMGKMMVASQNTCAVSEEKRRRYTHLDTVPSILRTLELAPADSFVGSCATVRPVKLLASIDVHAKVGTVAEQHRVRNLVLAHAAAEDDHAGLFRPDADIVQSPDIPDEVHNEPGIFVRVKVDHVA